MKKIDLVHTITVLANIGVIAGIVFLVFELQQNTLAVQSEAGQGVMDQIQAVYATLDDPVLEVLLKADENPASLTPVEIARIQIFYTVAFQAWQNIYFQVRSGAFDAERADGWWQELRQSLEFAPSRVVWDQKGYMLSQEFRDFVDEQVITREFLEGVGVFDMPIE